jgi:hypothetical protein
MMDLLVSFLPQEEAENRRTVSFMKGQLGWSFSVGFWAGQPSPCF